MRGVEAYAQSLRLAHVRDDVREMLESMTDARTLAGCNLQRDFRFHFWNLPKHLVDRMNDLLQTCFFARAEVRTRMQHQKREFKLICAD